MANQTTKLDEIKFDEDSAHFAGQRGYQETDTNGNLLHLYDEDGEQLDSGNGHFPNASWSLIKELGEMTDSDDFWNLIQD